jgi:hypothetical protein
VPSAAAERVARRANWKAPWSNATEYWLHTNAPNEPAVIAIIETDDAAPIMKAMLEWEDVFNITIFPAITAEQGLRLASEMAKAA